MAKNATDAWKHPIISKAVNLDDPVAVNYPIKDTGFYCVSTYSYSGREYRAVVEFRNAYGELPAAQIAKLPFYGALTIVYAVMGLYVLRRDAPDIGLPNIGTGRSYTCKIATIFVRHPMVLCLTLADDR